MSVFEDFLSRSFCSTLLIGLILAPVHSAHSGLLDDMFKSIEETEIRSHKQYENRNREWCRNGKLLSCDLYHYDRGQRYKNIERNYGRELTRYISQYYGCAATADGELGGGHNTSASARKMAVELGHELVRLGAETVARVCEPCSAKSDMPADIKEACLSPCDRMEHNRPSSEEIASYFPQSCNEAIAEFGDLQNVSTEELLGDDYDGAARPGKEMHVRGCSAHATRYQTDLETARKHFLVRCSPKPVPEVAGPPDVISPTISDSTKKPLFPTASCEERMDRIRDDFNQCLNTNCRQVMNSFSCFGYNRRTALQSPCIDDFDRRIGEELSGAGCRSVALSFSSELRSAARNLINQCLRERLPEEDPRNGEFKNHFCSREDGRLFRSDSTNTVQDGDLIMTGRSIRGFSTEAAAYEFNENLAAQNALENVLSCTALGASTGAVGLIPGLNIVEGAILISVGSGITMACAYHGPGSFRLPPLAPGDWYVSQGYLRTNINGDEVRPLVANVEFAIINIDGIDHYIIDRDTIDAGDYIESTTQFTNDQMRHILQSIMELRAAPLEVFDCENEDRFNINELQCDAVERIPSVGVD